MKTLVTGGTGCIGSTLVERLIAKGYDVRSLARRTSNLSHLRTTGAEIVFGDIAQYDSLPPVVRGIDMVFHCAAKVTPGWGTWPEYEANTVKGTENMLRASAEAVQERTPGDFILIAPHLTSNTVQVHYCPPCLCLLTEVCRSS